MPDLMNQSFTFRVVDVDNLKVPEHRDLIEVATNRRGQASISIQNANRPFTLQGEFDPERQVIRGDYLGYGPFEMTFEEDGEPRPRPRRPTLRRRVRCEVRFDSRDETDPGCWIAEEDGCCIHDDGKKPR